MVKDVPRMKSAWKTRSPSEYPAAYSMTRSTGFVKPSAVVTAVARMIPPASPATQWIVEPTARFHCGAMNCSCAGTVGACPRGTLERY